MANKKSFKDNAKVVREVVELLQDKQLRYSHKQQFLGDFFEKLLNDSIKQEAGQFFTPVPLTQFIIKSLPIEEMIKTKIANGEQEVLPNDSNADSKVYEIYTPQDLAWVAEQVNSGQNTFKNDTIKLMNGVDPKTNNNNNGLFDFPFTSLSGRKEKSSEYEQ